MRIQTLAMALGLTVATALAMPSEALAHHRHSRYCGHRYGYNSSYYDRYDSGYYYDDNGPRRYGYAYRNVWQPRSYVVVHYHGGVRCTRSHGGVHFRW